MKEYVTGIKIDIYYGFDEEGGYYLDTDSIREEFEQKLSELESDVENKNHERNEHLRTKHMEFPERETDGAEL
jgi:hypothetical protein